MWVRSLRMFVGLTHPEFKRVQESGEDYLYVDHSYFHRGAMRCRIVRGGVHLTRLLDRPADRLEQFGGASLAPWHKTGGPVVVIPPSKHQILHVAGADGWLRQTLERLAEVTQRRVLVKHNKGSDLRAYLHNCDAWAVVTFASVAGMEAAMWGFPVFATERCCAWPVSGRLEDIDTPSYPDRMPWLCALAYASWEVKELEQLNLEDYDYRCAS